MEITLEQIDLLRKRANVSYKEAKEALEKYNGNIVEALSYLEEQDRIKPEGGQIKNSPFVNSIKDIISKNEKTVLNISSLIALIIGVFTLPFSIAALLLLVLTHHRIRLEKSNGEECSINDKIDKISNDLTSVTDKVVKEFRE